MKYIKQFENNNELPKFAILHSYSNSTYWNGWYGVVLGKPNKDLYDIGILTPNAKELDVFNYMKGDLLMVARTSVDLYDNIDGFYQDLLIYYKDLDFDELKEQIEMFDAKINAEKYNL